MNLNPNGCDGGCGGACRLAVSPVLSVNAPKPPCVICGRAFYQSQSQHDEFSHMSRVLENLFIGGWSNASSREELRHFNIKRILNAAGELPNVFIAASTITYKKFTWSDDPFTDNISGDLHTAADFIHEALEAKEPILVHCAMGISRSTTCVIAYLIKYKGLTYDEALNLISKSRPIVRPNFAYVESLKRFGEILIIQDKLML